MTKARKMSVAGMAILFAVVMCVTTQSSAIAGEKNGTQGSQGNQAAHKTDGDVMSVDIEINVPATETTDDDKDDYIAVTNVPGPQSLPKTRCRAKLKQPSPENQDMIVVITGETGAAPGDGIVRFPEDSNQESAPLTLFANGTDWTEFWISGKKVSSVKDDCIIEAHKDTTSGGIVGKQELTVLDVDLDIDSDNNNGYDPPSQDPAAEDAIEADPTLPGKILCVNDDDSDGDGIPDYADGFDWDSSSGTAGETAEQQKDNASSSDDFAQLVLELPAPIDLSLAALRITYRDSDPAGVTHNGTPPVWAPGAGCLRIWKEDGNQIRNKNSAKATSNPGHYVPAGEYPDVSKLGLSGSTRSVPLYIEGIAETAALADRMIKVEVDPDGSGPAPYVPNDSNLVTVIRVELVTTDITGLDGIGSTPAASVPRVPLSEHPAGIACDGLNGVADGARLLVRALIPASLDPAFAAVLTADWGYTNSAGAFAALPTSPQREGEYLALSPAQTTQLTGLGVRTPGQVYELDASRRVLAAQIYKPPVELDLSTPNNPTNQRMLKLAADIEVSGNDLITAGVDTTLVRSPVVLVHGINSDAARWDEWKEKYEEDRGFVCKAVDHCNGLASGAPTFGGNGDVHSSYTNVRDGIVDITQEFRDGLYFSGKRIAVQKADIIAHSYGGVLSRWYVERAGTTLQSEFINRRNVRKLVTMGTPHRGAPVCNMMCEAYTNPVIYYAETAGSSPLWPTLGKFLTSLDGGWNVLGADILTIRWHAQGTPLNPNDASGALVVPALQCLSVGSAVLSELNTAATVFDDDVAYGAIVGTDSAMYTPVVNFNVNRWLEPMYDMAWLVDLWAKSYFPWYSGLDGQTGASDAIVPIWSQTLPASPTPFTMNDHHLSYHDSPTARARVCDWLNSDTLPRGAVHRSAFVPGAGSVNIDDQSRANAYRGSVFDPPGSENSRSAGLAQDAIVQVKFSKAHVEADFHLSTVVPSPTQAPVPPSLKSKGGIVKATCTGMVRDSGRTVSVVRDAVGSSDETLNANLAVPYSGTGELRTFSVTGRIGRTVGAAIVGPDGSAGNLIAGAMWSVGYEMSGSAYANWTGLQSPPARIEYPAFVLSPPTGSSPVPVAPGNVFTCEGGVHTTGTPGGSQDVQVRVIDNDPLPLVNQLLVDVIFAVSIPAEAFAGALIPFSGSINLYKDASGHVRGTSGSSGEASAEVFQSVPAIGQSSSTIVVSATP